MGIADIMNERDMQNLIGSLADISRGVYKSGYSDGSVVEQMAETSKVQKQVGEEIASGLRDIASSLEELAAAISNSKV